MIRLMLAINRTKQELNCCLKVTVLASLDDNKENDRSVMATPQPNYCFCFGGWPHRKEAT